MLIPILGTTALAVDVGYWYFKQRDMQNAADSAAIAAAQTADEDETSPSYDGTNDDFINVAKGTTARYGYVDGQDSVTVAASRVQCPADASKTCTQVQVNYISPLFFSPIVGFQGNKNSGTAQGVAALAIAGDTNSGGTFEACIWAKEDAPGVDAILANGVPKADVNGCDIFSNSDIRCNGGNMNAGNAIAIGNSSGCGDNQISHAGSPPDDPYKDLPIPSYSCGSYPQADKKDIVAGTNQISGSYNWSGTQVLCGDIVLTGDVTVTGDPNNPAKIVIVNGRLITQNNTFTATNSTLIFTGDEGNTTYHHYPTGTAGTGNVVGSGFDIAAPEKGDFHGIAIFLDPDLTTGVDIPEIGNAPFYNISGVFYAPNSDVTLSGIVNKAGSGYNCFILVVNTLRLNGTGEIFANSQAECASHNVDQITYGTAGRPWLVQ